MPDPFMILGAAVVKTACKIWFKDSAFAASLSTTIVDMLDQRISNSWERRRVARIFEDLEETVANKVTSLMEHEFSGVPQNERNAAVLAVADTFEQAKLTNSDLFAADLDPLFLEKQIRRGTKSTTRGIGEGGIGLYDRVLSGCCSYIIEMSHILPGFEVGVFGVLLARQNELRQRIDEVLTRISCYESEASGDRFEAAYRQLAAKQLDRLELFGVTLSESVQSYELSTAYISLSVDSSWLKRRMSDRLSSINPDLADEAKSDKRPISIESALSVSSRMFLRGDAGSGKTTLLQWVGVHSARRDFDEPLDSWNDSIPFLIQLRRYSDRELPAPGKFLSHVGRHIADEMPKGWVQEQLRLGRAVVLVDGIDELRESERDAARAWLRDLIDSFPNARYVVSSRPSAVTEAWLSREEFDPVEIEPMAWSDVHAFVTNWHAAFREVAIEEDERERLAASEIQLLDEIRSRRHLRQLTTSPLLTALLCALHLDRRMHLPEDRMELYQVALDMFLQRRDAERRIVADIQLSRTDMTLLLQDLAYWLVRNGWSDVSSDRVIDRFNDQLAVMPRVEADGRKVLQLLMDRVGLIRQPTVGRIDFIHRTFQEFLAAKAAIDADDIGVLAEHANDDQWRDVIVMACGHALRHQRNELFRSLLAMANADPSRKQTLHALAVACLESSHRLDEDILTAVQKVAQDLLPPRTFGEAEALSTAGDFVLDLLATRPPRGGRQAASTIRLASLIGGDQAFRLIERCSAFHGRQIVSDELQRAWRRFDVEPYARDILSKAPDATEFLRLDDPGLLAGLQYLNPVHLWIDFPRGYGDISGIANSVSIEDLYINDPELSDLGPVGTLINLVNLELRRLSRVSLLPVVKLPQLSRIEFDLRNIELPSHVSSMKALTSIQISNMRDDKLLPSMLASDITLRRLGLWDAKALMNIGGLAALPQLRRLNFLLLGNCIDLETLRGVENFAETLTGLYLTGAMPTDIDVIGELPNVDFLNLAYTAIEDAAFLVRLTKLRILHIGGASLLPSLAPLASLPSLERLFLWGEDDVDLRPLAGKPDITIEISNYRKRVILGAKDLGERSKVRSRA